jgi:hypothetical protein
MIYLCSCGFGTDDPEWFDGHLLQHPNHEQRPMLRYFPSRKIDPDGAILSVCPCDANSK